MHSLDCSVNCLVAATYPTGFLKGRNTIDIWRRWSLLYRYFFTVLRTNANLVRQRLNQLSDSRDRGKVWRLYWSLYFHPSILPSNGIRLISESESNWNSRARRWGDL